MAEAVLSLKQLPHFILDFLKFVVLCFKEILLDVCSWFNLSIILLLVGGTYLGYLIFTSSYPHELLRYIGELLLALGIILAGVTVAAYDRYKFIMEYSGKNRRKQG